MSSKSGKLILVPTPIEEIGEISSSLFKILQDGFGKGDCIVVEDPKPARRRWIGWGLPREAIESFIHYNEHTRKELDQSLLSSLKKGQNVFLMSDGGLPGFCDPGRSLIFEAHRQNLEVTMTAFANSLMSAITLSGFSEGAFEFLGFPSKLKDERRDFFKSLKTKSGVFAFMDTPYRLERVLEECLESLSDKSYISLAIDIGRDSQELVWGKSSQILPKALKSKLGKREFVMVIKN